MNEGIEKGKGEEKGDVKERRGGREGKRNVRERERGGEGMWF